MDDEGLFKLYRSLDDTEALSIYRFEGISEKALGMLAEASQVHPVSRASRICRALGIGLWDLVKVGAGGVLGWYLKRYFG